MSKQILSATALALLIGTSTFSFDTAIAQSGAEARSNDREIQKKLDDRELTPIRPIRRVGEENWPTAKDRPALASETSGQASKAEAKTEEPAKQDAAKQEPVKQDAATPEKQDTAKQDTPIPTAKPDAKPQDNAQKTDEKEDKGFASIRLGTDEAGRVAVNEAQERQIGAALRKQRVETVNVKVSIGSLAPANVRVVAVSSNVVEVLPQFRGYNYFATPEEIVIVAPSTRKVVATIPVKLTATASRPSEERTVQTEAKPVEAPKSAATTKERDRPVSRSARNDGVPSREEILAGPVVRGPAYTRGYRNYGYYEPDDDDVVIVERRRPRFYRMW